MAKTLKCLGCKKEIEVEKDTHTVICAACIKRGVTTKVVNGKVVAVQPPKPI